MLYVARTDDGRLKIGYSESLVRRTWQISVLFDQPVTLVALFPGTRDDENTLHERFKPYRVEVLATDRRVSRRETYRGESPVREWLDALPPTHRCEIRHDFRGWTTAITSQIKAHLAQFEVTSAAAARAAAGARLRALREKAGLSLVDAASAIGAGRMAWHQWEHGGAPTVFLALAVARLFGTTVEAIWGDAAEVARA